MRAALSGSVMTELASTVAKLRDASLDNALMLRSSSLGTAASRTHAFLSHCVQFSVSDLSERDVLSYAATRLAFEAGYGLTFRSHAALRDAAQGRHTRALEPFPADSHHQRTWIAAKPHWQALHGLAERVAEELVPAEDLSAIAKQVSPVVPSRKPGGSHPYARVKKRCQLLEEAAQRMGLPSVPLVSLIDLRQHGYFADRRMFDPEDGDEGAPDAALANPESNRSPVGEAESETAMGIAEIRRAFELQAAQSGVTAQATTAAARAKLRAAHVTQQMRAKADREKRLAGMDLRHADPGPDVPGAVVFEWLRQRHRGQSPSRGEEFWLSLKGLVFLLDPSTVSDKGRRLYYTMVLIPLYTGRDVTTAFAEMVKPDALLGDPLADDEDDDSQSGAGADTDSWAEALRAEADMRFTNIPCSLGAMRQRHPHRNCPRSSMSLAQRRHVDRVFELLRQDSRIIGVLDDGSRELWL